MVRVRQSAEGGSVQRESRRWQVERHELTGGMNCLQPGPAVSNGVRIGRVETTALVGTPCDISTAIAIHESVRRSRLRQALSDCSKKVNTPILKRDERDELSKEDPESRLVLRP